VSWQVATLADGIGWWTRCRRVTWKLRETQVGRDGITALIGEQCVTVRQWSATNALAWAPRKARAELTREVEEGRAGAFEAQVTLLEFDAGRLNTAWKPKT
jgi:hypothetical protein